MALTSGASNRVRPSGGVWHRSPGKKDGEVRSRDGDGAIHRSGRGGLCAGRTTICTTTSTPPERGAGLGWWLLDSCIWSGDGAAFPLSILPWSVGAFERLVLVRHAFQPYQVHCTPDHGSVVRPRARPELGRSYIIGALTLFPGEGEDLAISQPAAVPCDSTLALLLEAGNDGEVG